VTETWWPDRTWQGRHRRRSSTPTRTGMHFPMAVEWR
jgi:hypothetical protein